MGFDFPHSKLVLVKKGSKPKHYDIQHWVVIPFTDHLLTKLYFNHKPILLSWDTGATPSVIKEQYASQFKQIPCPTAAPYAKKNCISIASSSLFTPSQNSLPNIWFKTTDIPSAAPFDGLIGMNYFKNNLIYFDFDHHKIYVRSQNRL